MMGIKAGAASAQRASVTEGILYQMLGQTLFLEFPAQSKIVLMAQQFPRSS